MSAPKIRGFVSQQAVGEPFATSELLHLGTRSVVDRTLSRLVQSGELIRITRGVFARPRKSRFVGTVLPSIAKIAEAKARALGVKLGLHGANAAQQFGFTTQVPMQNIFYINGYSHKMKVGNVEIEFRRASEKSLHLAGTVAGAALTALKYLGKSSVNEAVLLRLKRLLPFEEFQKLRQSVTFMPGWLSDCFYKMETNAA
jgi:hypothetical protein